MPCFVLSDREHSVRARLSLCAVAALVASCTAPNLELLREEALTVSPSNVEVQGVPLDYLRASISRSLVKLRVDCGGQPHQGNAFVIKRSGKRSFLLTAWSTLHPAQCQPERLHIAGPGIPPQDIEVRADAPPRRESKEARAARANNAPPNLDDMIGARGSESAGIVLFSVAGQPEGPTLQLFDYDAEGKGKNSLLASEAVGGPVVLIATGQAVGVVVERQTSTVVAGQPPYKMASIGALASELREQAEVDVREQIGPYGLDPLKQAPLGRPEETAIKAALSRRTPPPFVLLIAGAGVGTSELANKLAWEQVWGGEFPDGVLRLQVHDRPTDEVLGELHRVVLRRPPQPALSATADALASSLRGKRMLIVLDDLRLEGDRLPNELSHALGETAVLATSKRLYTDLRIQAVELGNLTPDMAREVLRGTLGEAQRRSFSDADVDLLCTRLSYNPLALKLAAGTIERENLTVQTYLERWQEVRLSTQRDTTAEGSLAVVFEVTWQGLSSHERAALSGMGLLAEAPVASDLLAALLGEQHATVAAALDKLVAQRVLDRPSSRREVSLHPLIYAWAKEKAAGGFWNSWKRDRVVRWFMLRSQDLPSSRWGLGMAAQLQAAQEWAIRDGKLQQAYQLADAWHARLRDTGPWSLWDRMWRNSVEASLKSEDRKTLMLSLRQLARTREQAGYSAGAEPLYRESLKIARDINDQRAIVETLNELGSHENSTSEAVLLLKTSLEQAQLLGDRALIANTWKRLGIAYSALPDAPNADKALQQSLTIYTELSDGKSSVEVMQALYELAMKKPDIELGRSWLVRSIETCERLGDPQCALPSILNLGRLAEQQGNAQEAQRQFDRALAAAKQIPDPTALAMVLDELGRREERRGDIAAALSLWQKARDSAQKSTDLKLKISVAVFGADLAYRLRDFALADEQLDLALGMAARLGDRRAVLSYVTDFNYLRWSRTHLARQLARLQDARQQAAAARNDSVVPMLDLAIARIHRLRRESDRAQEAIARSAQAYEGKRNEQGLAMVVAARGALAASTGDHASPKVSFTRALALCEKTKEDAHVGCTKAVADDAIEVQQWPAAQKGLDRHLAALRAQGGAKSRTLELANAVEEIAVLAMLRGDRATAAKRYQEALGLWQKLRADLAVARVLERMARLAWDRGDGLLSAEWLTEALAVSRSFDNKGDTWARMRLLQAQIALKQKQNDQARAYASEAAALFDKLHSPEAATARAVLKKL